MPRKLKGRRKGPPVIVRPPAASAKATANVFASLDFKIRDKGLLRYSVTPARPMHVTESDTPRPWTSGKTLETYLQYRQLREKGRGYKQAVSELAHTENLPQSTVSRRVQRGRRAFDRLHGVQRKAGRSPRGSVI